jgi:hypothetical protein
LILRRECVGVYALPAGAIFGNVDLPDDVESSASANPTPGPWRAPMATDIFAKLGDIRGESADAKQKDEIEVLSFSTCRRQQC